MGRGKNIGIIICVSSPKYYITLVSPKNRLCILSLHRISPSLLPSLPPSPYFLPFPPFPSPNPLLSLCRRRRRRRRLLHVLRPVGGWYAVVRPCFRRRVDWSRAGSAAAVGLPRDMGQIFAPLSLCAHASFLVSRRNH